MQLDDLMRTRVGSTEKAAFATAAAAKGLDLSEWVRRACRDRFEDEMGTSLRIGVGEPESNGEGGFSWE